ncbi:MAG TPA: cell envelope integrity protein TolA [Telluria sp.]|nr:cell envelope integrity protein TolA [Telluria sp.]
MPDHSHFSPENDGICTHCGHTLTVEVTPYGQRGPSRTGLAVTVLLHLLLIAGFLLHKNTEKHAAPPAGATMVYISPLPVGKPKPKRQQQQAPKKAPKTPPVQIKRLPNTITLPNEKPVEVVEEEPKKVTPPPPEMDMQAYIDARRKARGAKDPSDQKSTEESEDARATRVAMANIAAANGRTHGDDKNETGGVFSLSNKTFHSADLKFRGWNPNFKRRWLQQVTVEQGTEVDVEHAIIKKMIELIRKEKTGDFEWDSHRLQRVVTMSARPADTAALEAFLFKEMFPEYKR